MRFSVVVGVLMGLTSCLAASIPGVGNRGKKFSAIKARTTVIAPKVLIISMFTSEADIWYSNSNTKGGIGSLLAQNITVPGFSPLYPDAHCIASGDVCQVTLGEAEINAAVTMAALVYSNLFDLTSTYFLIAGIAGINPKQGSTGSVAFSKYAVQVGLQYEFDAREKPDNFSTGYFPQGSTNPNEYPTSIYGTEVFELNSALRDLAVSLASGSSLSDSTSAQSYRSQYSVSSVQSYIATSGNLYTTAQQATLLSLTAEYVPGTQPPSILTCDTATSDVYFSGQLLGEAFENTTSLFTNGGGVYCMTAQEDNATLEVLLRAATHGLVDFSRIILMRAASDFDRPYPGLSPLDNLVYVADTGFEPAVDNIYVAGVLVVQGILDGWVGTYEGGVPATNYIGDIFGTLGGTPDFGPGTD